LLANPLVCPTPGTVVSEFVRNAVSGEVPPRTLLKLRTPIKGTGATVVSGEIMLADGLRREEAGRIVEVIGCLIKGGRSTSDWNRAIILSCELVSGRGDGVV